MFSLKHLIESLVREVLKETTSPEAPEDSLVGEYLWADPEQEMRWDRAQEPDTEEEAKLLKAIRGWYVTGMPSAFFDAIPIIEKLIDEGHYAKYFKPPNEPVYRYLSGLSVEKAASILEISVEDEIRSIVKQPKLFGPGVLLSQQPITSWTARPLAEDAMSFAWGKQGTVTLLFQANPNAAGNTFMLNPIELVRTFDSDMFSVFLQMEMEVVAIGDTTYDNVACIYYEQQPAAGRNVARKLVAALES